MSRQAGAPLRGGVPLPAALLALGFALWVALGAWAVCNAPFASGTDESVSYVAFAAAKHRWATEADFRAAGVEHFYYPPLYFLLFAPFYGADPAFVEGFPRSEVDPNYLTRAGRTMRPPAYLARVPPALDRLYRHAKLFSLALGLAVLASLAGTLRLLMSGPARWWLVLLGTAPLLFLPQFLYYQTLCNNDALVNALSAAAAFSFVAALRSLEEGRSRAFTALSLAVAACVGLAVLTKMSGFTLLPLLFFLSAARALAPGAERASSRVRCGLVRLSILLATAFASGGWWVLHKAAEGDWDGMKAQVVAHPWAFRTPISHLGADQIFQRVVFCYRSYYAMFGGLLDISVPDTLCLATLLVPALWGAVFVLLLIRATREKQPLRLWRQRRPLRTLMWAGLSAVVLLNATLIALYVVRGVDAGEYGRLLFPSLVPAHAIFGGVLARWLDRRPRSAALASALLTAWYAGLFAWAFTTRMADAIAQPREDVRVLSSDVVELLPLEDGRVEQPITVPAGKLTGFRVQILRKNNFPQLGARLEGAWIFHRRGGPWEKVRLRPVTLGDFDNCRRWVEIDLPQTIELSEEAEGSLLLFGTAPHPSFSFVHFFYALGRSGDDTHRKGAILEGSHPTDLALCVAAVYQLPTSSRLP